jgi:hypothetical protein
MSATLSTGAHVALRRLSTGAHVALRRLSTGAHVALRRLSTGAHGALRRLSTGAHVALRRLSTGAHGALGATPGHLAHVAARAVVGVCGVGVLPEIDGGRHPRQPGRGAGRSCC